MKLNLLVVRTEKLEALKKQYEFLGFVFDYHQHGNGPFHYASEKDGFVFEIYPLTKSMTKADKSLRLGFEIENLKEKEKHLNASNWKIISKLQKTEWGLITVVQDLGSLKFFVIFRH